MTLGSRPSVSVAHELPPGVLPGSQEPRGKGVRWRGLVACGMSPPRPGAPQESAKLVCGKGWNEDAWDVPCGARCRGTSRVHGPREASPLGADPSPRCPPALDQGRPMRSSSTDAGHALRPAEKDREAAPGARQAASRPPCIPLPQEASGRPLSQREGRNRAPGRGRRVGEEPVAISHPCSGPSTGKGPGLRRSGRVCVRACVHRRVRASS